MLTRRIWLLEEVVGRPDLHPGLSAADREAQRRELALLRAATRSTDAGVSGNDRTGQSAIGVTRLDARGYNMIANMERDVGGINGVMYDPRTGRILRIPTTATDVGFGFDFIRNPMDNVPEYVDAEEAFRLLQVTVAVSVEAIARGINANFTQNQFNALVGLRYHVGFLGNIEGLIEYLEAGRYERNALRAIINAYYDDVIRRFPGNEVYRQGWYNRTERFLDIFFDGNYGYMPIDAVNGRVVLRR